MEYNLPINGIYWGYNPFTNHLLTSWDIQVDLLEFDRSVNQLMFMANENPPRANQKPRPRNEVVLRAKNNHWFPVFLGRLLKNMISEGYAAWGGIGV